MKRRGSPRPPSASASRAAPTRSPMCSRPCTPPMAARCRSPACSPARPATAPRSSPGRRGRPRRRRFQAGRTGHREARAGRGSARPSRFGKLDNAKTGDTLTAGKQAHRRRQVEPYPPVLAIAVSAKERKDDVKLGQALQQAAEEDPSITVVHNPETHEVVMWGQGEMHLRVATERLADRYGVAIDAGSRPSATARPSAEGHRPARPPQEAVGRPRPVRRCRARDQAAAARLGLQVRRQDHRRRGAAQLHPVGRGGRHRRAQARSARLPGGRRRR